MAKKKKDDLPDGFEEKDGVIIHTETGDEYEKTKDGLLNKETGEIFNETPSKPIGKKFKKLGDYRSKVKMPDVEFKKQDWIDMSHAYKDVTKLPGVPVGHITMVYGKSDTGKSTLAIEAAAYAQKAGIVPVFIITENKFSFERAETMGVNFEDALVYNGVKTIEEGCEYVRQLLEDQENGDLPYDILILWDSVGATPSERELSAVTDGSGSGGMMVTAKVLREQISRSISFKINGTRNKAFPYNATMIIVNHAYTTPPVFPAKAGSVVPYGGDAIYYSAGIVMRMGGVMSRSSKVTATKSGVKVAFGLKSALKIEKNHITNIAAEGKIICTDHGFIVDDKTTIDAYKKEYKDGWDLEFDKFWDAVSLD